MEHHNADWFFCEKIFFFSSDNVKKALAQHGFAEHLANVVSSLQNEKDEYLQQRVQSSADFIVMLLIEGYKIVCILNLFYLPSVRLSLPGLQIITLSFRKYIHVCQTKFTICIHLVRQTGQVVRCTIYWISVPLSTSLRLVFSSKMIVIDIWSGCLLCLTACRILLDVCKF